MINRRMFLKGLTAGAGCLPLMSMRHLMAAEPDRAEKPNVVFIFVDDLGSVDLNCYGSADLHTPNLDRLAEQGTRFTQFYAAAPICSPSRAALMTGRFPRRAGLPNNAWGDRGLPAEQVTMGEVFQRAGYRTALFGKWHLGETLQKGPNAQGFDEFLGHRVGCIDNYSHYFYWRGPNKHDLWKDETEHFEPGVFFPDIIVRQAKRFLNENTDKPFFLYLPFNLPHYPMQAEQKYMQRYENIKDPNRRRYAAFVTSLDDRIGQVIDTIDALKLRRNTIIVFASDNGHSVEEQAFGGGGSAGPYRGHKSDVWEGGIRMPCIVSWLGRLPQGQVRNQVTAAIDWLPTIGQWCGVNVPNEIDGKDITEVIKSADAPTPHKVLYWEFYQDWAVREGKWKLVCKKGEYFLSDMEKDVTETKNLASAFPEIVKRLKKLHDQWINNG